MGKKNKQVGEKSVSDSGNQSKTGENSSKAKVKKNPYDKDTMVFIAMSQELKDEGNRLFQKRDHEGAMVKYEEFGNKELW